MDAYSAYHLWAGKNCEVLDPASCYYLSSSINIHIYTPDRYLAPDISDYRLGTELPLVL